MQVGTGYYLWAQVETYLAEDSRHPFPCLSPIPSHDDAGTRSTKTHQVVHLDAVEIVGADTEVGTQRHRYC